MATPYLNRRVYQQDVEDAYTLTNVGDAFKFSPTVPVDVVRWGFTVTTTAQVGAGMAVTGDWRPTVGSDTNRVTGSVSGGVDTGLGSITASADIAAGKMAYHECSSPFEVDPGEEVVLKVSNAADTAGVARFFIEYIVKPFVGDSGVTAGGESNRIANATKYAS